MGCIYRRSKIYWIKYSQNGKPFAESTKSDKKQVAVQLLKLREGEISQGKLPGVYFERVSFDEIMDDYVSDYRINKRRTIARAEECSNALRKAFAGLKAVGITTPVIRRYVEKRLSDGLANGTINRELSALKKAFNLAFQCTPPKVARVPFIPMLKESNVRKGFIEYGEYLAIRELLPVYLKPVLSFGYFTGWRKTEILTLTWGHPLKGLRQEKNIYPGNNFCLFAHLLFLLPQIPPSTISTRCRSFFRF